MTYKGTPDYDKDERLFEMAESLPETLGFNSGKRFLEWFYGTSTAAEWYANKLRRIAGTTDIEVSIEPVHYN